MKAMMTIILSMLVLATGIAQENEITTQSAKIDDLISFVVKNYDVENPIDRKITFLIQTNNDQLSSENAILLRQGFKLISERLTENSKITIVTYNKFSGVALNPTQAKQQKVILHTLSDLKDNISQFYEDGMTLAYQTAEQNFDDELENSVVIIRNANEVQNQIVDIEKHERKAKNKKKTNAILVTALALLPELIEVIKD